MLLYLLSLSLIFKVCCEYHYLDYLFRPTGTDNRWPFGNVTFTHPVQSPVDIVTSKSYFRQLPRLQFIAHLSKDVETVVNNTGHTVYILLKDNYSPNREPPHIKGGPLTGKYYFEQLHMHWGSTDKWGSEHFLDGESFSIEGHAVHYNSKYGNFLEAVKHKDGIAVLTIFAKATTEPNHLLDELVDLLPEISEAGSSKTVPSSKALQWFISSRTINDYYFTYPGSLTTSPYSENVIFIIFPKPLNLSQDQLAKFRTLQNNHDGQFILENKRQLQPLNRRPILKSYLEPVRHKRETRGQAN